MADDPRFITTEKWAEIVATADIPEALRDHLSGKVQPDGLVHWRGADQQEIVWFFGVHRPSRCGRFAHDMQGYPLRYVTCPKCLELAEADGVPALIERQGAEILDAFEIPQQLRDAWREISDAYDADIQAGHDAADCPQRTEITKLSDPAPRWMHGDCQPKEA